jgi:ribosomal subunit interface protein
MEPLQITFRDLAPSPALSDAIKLRAAKLSRFHDRITSCRVVVEAKPRHRFGVHLELSIPGGEIVVSHEPDETDAYVAVREAFEAARRQLDETAQRL